jgi:cysteine desulfurase / selenocysteine lyase
MGMDLLDLVTADEQQRQNLFPICRKKIFMAHAGVTALPGPVENAMTSFLRRLSDEFVDFSEVIALIQSTREAGARLIRGTPEEVALLGPTSLGLSLVANGIDWKPEDEVLCYLDDYPANVYPWLNLRSRGVQVRFLNPQKPGELTPELINQNLTPGTRLVALASCNFLSGYRIEIDLIGQMLRKRGILFCLDAIQTLGAFPTTVENVDFLSADAHKWLLGPVAVGIVFVRRSLFEQCQPTLLGAWNVKNPNFITQEEIEFVPTAQRYEPGVLNFPGIAGMKAAIDLLLEIGIDRVGDRIRQLCTRISTGLEALGFEPLGVVDGPNASGIVTVAHPSRDLAGLYKELSDRGVMCSAREDRAGRKYLRFSPHFYNTEAEVDQVLEIIRSSTS